MAGYELTREDIEKIALTGKAVEDLAVDIAEIKTILKDDARNCHKCKEGIDTQLKAQTAEINGIKAQHTGEKAVTSFIDTTLGRISVCIGILVGAATLIITVLIPGILTLVGRA